ncbi:MAG: MFS transporter [Acidimicrobiia bacterium]
MSVTPPPFGQLSRTPSQLGDDGGAPLQIRRRLTGVLFGGVAISRTGYIAAITMTTLVAEDMLGSATLAGLPGAISVLGTALGGNRLSALMDRVGRRRGLSVGYGILAVGAAGAAAATAVGSFPLLVVAMAVFGTGASADNLARYAAADVYPAQRRGSAIAFVVWAGTIGSVAGPSLLDPSEALGRALGIDPLAGAYVLAGFTAAAALGVVSIMLRPDPLDFADRGDPTEAGARAPLSALVRTALVALAVGHVVMVLIMVMTPIHVRDHGHGLGTVGLIISAHTLGMFALSPLTGIVADRIGRLPVILVGHIVLAVAATLAAVADESATGLLALALFLLGLGWNFSFVAGSALLTEGANPAVRVRRQGLGDAVVWTSAAIAGLASGFLLTAGSYAVLSIVAASLTVVPVVMVLREWSRTGSGRQ